MVEPRRIKDRSADGLSEERELASVVTGSSADEAGLLPRLHAGLDEARPSTGVPVWAMPSAPSSPDDPVVDATGWASGQRGLKKRGLKSRARRIAGLLEDGYKVVLGAQGAATAERLSDLLADHGAHLNEPPAADDLHSGAILNGVKLAVLASSDVTGRRRAVRHRYPRSSNGRDARRFFEGLSPGSFVVHHRHGIGRFEGMVRRSVGGCEREYLLLAYRGRDRLYVPTDQVDSVRRSPGGASSVRASRSVATAARAPETGQPVLVASASCWNCASSIPATTASHSSSILAMAKPPRGTLLMWTAALVWTRCGSKPARARPTLSAIE